MIYFLSFSSFTFIIALHSERRGGVNAQNLKTSPKCCLTNKNAPQETQIIYLFETV